MEKEKKQFGRRLNVHTTMPGVTLRYHLVPNAKKTEKKEGNGTNSGRKFVLGLNRRGNNKK